jgi:hypothetical protein
VPTDRKIYYSVSELAGKWKTNNTNRYHLYLLPHRREEIYTVAICGKTPTSSETSHYGAALYRDAERGLTFL